tara:strand:- start:859 stop:1080 length:222 start_codon:yes stop_codon:yes gene_type:complete
MSQPTFPIVLNGADHDSVLQTKDGLENNFMYLNAKTVGTGTESIAVDSDQNCLIMGPVTFNCTLTINGTLKVI